ncbi:MAG TPA: glycosyltransferase family 2 protein [Gammaproteobacteria bacterium]|nr:glycosyltransferase family 2 protein [Gammaproteobacteria bacterium]
MPDTPLITVALCTHNHADRLVRTLADFAQLHAPERDWEWVVVDNASTDDTAEILAAADWRPAGVPVRVVRESKLGLSNARNRALKEARGEYLLFIDDDETPDPDWLRGYEHAILTHRPDALGGRIEVMFEHGDRPPWLQDELLGFLGLLNYGEAQWLTEPNTPFYGGNFAVRRELFARIGEFDPDLGRKGGVNDGGEDTEFYRRLLAGGHRVRWVPESTIYHRIEVDKLRRGYFLGLHYRQGRMEGLRKRGNGSRFPPRYLFGQLLRAAARALGQRLKQGSTASLRREMNVAYFWGYVLGWSFAARAPE